ncbi:uncharacterized protein [Spinacia oleracea]|uniref:Uncharacterized protein n=1 Tax=Spinacia oleracea TaxID=3562 RepID=A0ABM3RSY7_SPIOL|nr:uncharacterized protein LOC130472235 [Spinacia oleracea]
MEGGWGLSLGGETAPRGDGDGGLRRQKQAREGGEGREQGRNQGRRGVMVTGGLGGGSGRTGRRRNREAPERRWWWWCGFAAAKRQGRGEWSREQGKAEGWFPVKSGRQAALHRGLFEGGDLLGGCAVAGEWRCDCGGCGRGTKRGRQGKGVAKQGRSKGGVSRLVLGGGQDD